MKKRTKKQELQRRKNIRIALERVMNNISQLDLDKITKEAERKYEVNHAK